MSDKSDNPLAKIGGVIFDTAETVAGDQLEKHPVKPLVICGVKTLKVFFEHHTDSEKIAVATKSAVQVSQATIGACQTTALPLVGAGLAAVGVGLAALNLYQTLKLRALPNTKITRGYQEFKARSKRRFRGLKRTNK